MTQRVKMGLVAVGTFVLGGLLMPQLPSALGQAKPKVPKWQHAFTFGVRKHNEANFTRDTKQYGVEVYRDENNGNLIYIAETGSIAVVRGQ